MIERGGGSDRARIHEREVACIQNTFATTMDDMIETELCNYISFYGVSVLFQLTDDYEFTCIVRFLFSNFLCW